MENLNPIIAIIVITIILMVYGEIKKNLKKNVFQKDNYEEGKRLLRKKITMHTDKSKSDILKSLDNYIIIDGSAKAAFVGGGYSYKDKENEREYTHSSKLTTIDDRDEFKVSIRFYEENGILRVICEIKEWKEVDDIVSKSAVQAMQDFFSKVEQAFRAIDSNADIR